MVPPAPSRRALTKAATATVAAAPALHRLVATDSRSATSAASVGAEAPAALAPRRDGGPVRLRPEPGGVRATDVALDALDAQDATSPVRGAAPGPAGSRRIDTGPVDTDTFSMLGVTWRGAPTTVLVRTRARGTGTWSGWTRLHPLVDGPDLGTGEGDPTLRATEPTWVGAADGLHVRVVGEDARGLRLSLIEPEAEPSTDAARPAARAVAGTARATSQAVAERRRRSPLRPAMRTRRSWGADESLRDGSPSYNDTIKQVHVHHTVNSNDYRRSEVAGLIRGMYRYHTQSLGWSDLGYNFLVDRFGRIWEGRYGGAGRAVRGAHTLGFNHGSTGVSVIGNFETAKPNARILRAVARVAAWKLHLYGRTPRGTVTVVSKGSDRYPDGRRLRARTVDGHRDTNQTACPGSYLYARIRAVRRRGQRRLRRLT